MASRFVIGVDGFERSRAALAWAIREASAQGAVVQPVIVWQRTFDYGQQEYWPADDAIAEAARTRLTATVAATAGPDSALTIDPLVAEGDPAKVLCELPASADLLVVGSRGLGGFAGLILGSVSAECAHHSRCPGGDRASTWQPASRPGLTDAQAGAAGAKPRAVTRRRSCGRAL